MKIFGYRPTKDLHDQWDALIQCFAQNGLTVEISTAGLYKQVGEIYPSEQIIKLLKKYNVPIVINSDAHQPQNVGRSFEQAVDLVSKFGLTTVARFAGRKLIQKR